MLITMHHHILFIFLLLAARLFNYEALAANYYYPYKIMPLGDVHTEGSKKVHGAYRTAFYTFLTNIGYNIDFVGSQKSPTTPTTLADTDHEGHGDWKIPQFTLYVEEFLEKADPDVVLLLVGANDIPQGVEEALKNTDDLIQKILAIRPTVELFVANLPRRKNKYQNSLVETYNTGLEPIVQKYIDDTSSADTNVHFVNINAVVPLSAMSTNIQPKQIGYDNIGEKLAVALTFKLGPDGNGLQNRAILRAAGAMDRKHVMVTFSRPLPGAKAYPSNFEIDGGIDVLGVTLSSDRRDAILQTSRQSHQRTYQVTVKVGAGGGNMATFNAGWRAIILSDLHLAEKYVFATKLDEIQNDVQIATYLKETLGGDLVLIPGDTNAGFWSTESFRESITADLGYSVSSEYAVKEAGRRCYNGILDTFRKGGYWNVLVAYGDHEAGDNPWKPGSKKSELQPQFRETFGNNVNIGIDGEYLFNENIGDLTPRPFGTAYEGTSYAYIHKNALIVTVNVLYQQNSRTKIGDTGTVTGTVNGAHLEWLDSILAEGLLQDDVKHIFVQGHFPVLFPVRKVQSSGLYVDGHDESDFIEVMRKNRVDIYFAGEAHLNTVTKDEKSKLIQVVSRGNFFSNVLTVDVSDDQIKIICHNEMGEEKTMHNYNYVESGSLSIQYRASKRLLKASGELSFLDLTLPMIHFTFEEVFPLSDRPVLGLGELPGVRRAPIVSEVPVDGMTCYSSLPNTGAFGQNYDAQVTNIDFITGVYGNAGSFSVNSRAAVFGMGPHTGGKPITYSLWIRTTQGGKRILLSYEGYWSKQNVMNLRLRNGVPELSYSETQQIRSQNGTVNDGIWHHLSVVMPFENCLLSDTLIYVDGVSVDTLLVGTDENLKLPNGGMIAVGGFGHGNVGSGNSSRKGFMGGAWFVGDVDEVSVWARSLNADEIRNLATPPKSFTLRSKISYRDNEAMCIGFGLSMNELVIKECNDSVTQQWVIDSIGLIHSKIFYQKCLASDSVDEDSPVKLFQCYEHDTQNSRWIIKADGSIQLYGDSTLYLTVNEEEGNTLELSHFTDLELQNWDIVYEDMYPASYLTTSPSAAPSSYPSLQPTQQPSSSPSYSPTIQPSTSPTNDPTSIPTIIPTQSPSALPSQSPSKKPSVAPSSKPTTPPSISPSDVPSMRPTVTPSSSPTDTPSIPPSFSQMPSARPTRCEDQKDGFGRYPTEPGRPSKTCEQVENQPGLCKFPNIQQGCPIACNLDCDAISQDCFDSETSFPNPTGSQNFCMDADIDPDLCTQSWFQENCKMTCFGTCSECADLIVGFTNPSGITKYCSTANGNPNICERDWFNSLCPLKCNICEAQKATGVGETCEDNPDIFLNSKGKELHCASTSTNLNLCSKEIFQENCKMSCFGTCDSCADTLGIIFRNKFRPCSKATTSDHILCTNPIFERACPKACGVCS